MANEKLGDLVRDLSLDDIRLDSFGRVVITSPTISDRLKAVGSMRPDDLARSDTNFICCGNGTCSAKGSDPAKELGSLVERFTRGGLLK